MNSKKLLNIAHRGGRKWAPENTLSAFRRSLEADVDGIELDIHRCSTGELVVIHDHDIGRTTNGVGLVKDISYPELKRVDAGSWFAPEFAGEYIPLLQEVLDLIDGQLIINIEIKNTPVDYPGIDDDLIDLLSGYKHCDKIIVSSFDHKILQRIHHKQPALQLAILANVIFTDISKYSTQVGAAFWHPDFNCLRKDAVDEAHLAGLSVNSWTINSARDWATGLNMGLDGIITDDPAGLAVFLSKMLPSDG